MNKEQQKLIRLSDVPKFIYDKSGIVRSRSIIYSWARHGRLSYDNRPIKLKTKTIMGQKFTTEEWLMDFIDQLGR